MGKLTLADTTFDIAKKMSEGNPGALNVVMQMMLDTKNELSTDGILAILYLDELGIYSSRIWMLYKDCCNCDLGKVDRVLRGWQLGLLTKEDIDKHIDSSESFDLPTVEKMLNRGAVSELA